MRPSPWNPSPRNPFHSNPSHWKESSIVCLDDHQAVLYAELIQHVPKHSLAWLRPLALKVDESSVPEELIGQGDRLPDGDTCLFDVRNTADLIWPIQLFRMGLDTEVIDVIAALPDIDPMHLVTESQWHVGRQMLNTFLHTAWKANRDLFPARVEGR